MRRVAAASVNVRLLPTAFQVDVKLLQPPEPLTLPSFAKLGVTFEPATGLATPPLPLLMPVARHEDPALKPSIFTRGNVR
jgi:hypothetical protein